MSLRVTLRSKVKPIRCSRSESESKQGDELQEVDPKPGDLPMVRVKLG